MNLKHKLDRILEQALQVLETVLALISTCVLIALLAVYLVGIFRDPGFFFREDSVHRFLQQVLSIVVGLEFVKLLMHMTPANILEVLTMAIARHIVVGHAGPMENFLSIASIVGLFAAKHFLIPRNELNRNLEDDSSDSGPCA